MKVQINRDLIRLIEEYAGSLDAFSDIENISLYHDLSIYGDSKDSLIRNSTKAFAPASVTPIVLSREIL